MDRAWGLHAPGFPVGLAGWLAFFPLELWSVRLYSLLPAVAFLCLLGIWTACLLDARSGVALAAIALALFFDKLFFMQAPVGRMEFHALFFLILSAWSLYRRQPPTSRRLLLGGFLYGTSALFHPFTVFFAPAFLAFLWPLPAKDMPPQPGSFQKRSRDLIWNGLRFAAGVLPAIAAGALWFVWQSPFAWQQFQLAASGSSFGTFTENLRLLPGALLGIYRFQPALLLAVAGTLILFALALLLPSTRAALRQKTDRNNARALCFALIGIVCFFCGILRGSTTFVYYYTYLSFFFYLWIASTAGILLRLTTRYSPPVTFSISAFPRFGIFSLLLLLLCNNLATPVQRALHITANRNPDPAPQFYSNLSQLIARFPPDTHFAFHPHLWLFASQKNLRWMPSFLPLVGQPPQIYSAYHRQLIAFQPALILRGKNEWPERTLPADVLVAGGYEKTGELSLRYAKRSVFHQTELEIWEKIQSP